MSICKEWLANFRAEYWAHQARVYGRLEQAAAVNGDAAVSVGKNNSSVVERVERSIGSKAAAAARNASENQRSPKLYKATEGFVNSKNNGGKSWWQK